MNTSVAEQVPFQNWKFHADHSKIIAETHARPPEPIAGPAEVFHFALRCNEETATSFFDIIDPAPHSDARHLTGKIGKVRVKLERHTEFLSCTFFQELSGSTKNVDMIGFIQQHFPLHETEILLILKLSIVETIPQLLKTVSGEDRIYGGKIRNEIDVRSSFKPDERGIVHLALCGKSVTRDEFGRRVQRLLEMETYRTMSLHGLQVARRISQEISDCEQKLEELTRNLRNNTRDDQRSNETLFNELSDLSERNNMLLTQSRYRFAACRAYFTLFQQRTDSLEEQIVGDLQTMSGFLRSRIEPAMATIESTAKRQETLTNDLSRAIVLLRTRIELNLNKGNQDLLKSMDKRHDQQLKISQTVEGLSIIAITYYAVGLVSYFLKALAAQDWMPFSEKLLTASSVPFVFMIVYLSLHRIRKTWEERKSGD